MNLTTSEIQDFLDEPKEFLDERLAMPINNEMASFRARGINTQSDYLIDINRKRCIITRITFPAHTERKILYTFGSVCAIIGALCGTYFFIKMFFG